MRWTIDKQIVLNDGIKDRYYVLMSLPTRRLTIRTVTVTVVERDVIVENKIKVPLFTAIVKAATFSVAAGEVVGLLGPNGAGKTTAFYMVVGLIYPSSGNIFLGEQDITQLPMHVRAQLGIGYLPQNVSIFRRMTVEDNLRSVMEINGVAPGGGLPCLDEFLSKFHIQHLAKSLGSALSGGERRRVEIARALITRPKFLLLDEPFAGIDPLTVQQIQEIIKVLTGEGLGVLITDHNARETLRICDQAYILSAGEIIAHGLAGEVSANPLVRHQYLGDDFQL